MSLGLEIHEMTDEGFLFFDLRHLGTGFRMTADVRAFLPSLRYVGTPWINGVCLVGESWVAAVVSFCNFAGLPSSRAGRFCPPGLVERRVSCELAPPVKS